MVEIINLELFYDIKYYETLLEMSMALKTYNTFVIKFMNFDIVKYIAMITLNDKTNRSLTQLFVKCYFNNQLRNCAIL